MIISKILEKLCHVDLKIQSFRFICSFSEKTGLFISMETALTRKKKLKRQSNLNLFLLYHLLLQQIRRRIPVGIYMFKVNNRNTRTRCEICSKLTYLMVLYLKLINKLLNDIHLHPPIYEQWMGEQDFPLKNGSNLY